jgi:hypothetical protein
VLANKFLHDRVYSNKAWGKVSGLEVRPQPSSRRCLFLASDTRPFAVTKTTEISLGELALGSLLDWALWVRDEPVVVVVPAAYAAPEPSTSAPELVPLKSKRSWQPKRPLGPGRHDRAFRSTLGDYPPTPSVPSVLAGESSQHQPAKRRFSASKSFSPSTAAAAASKEHVSKRARVVEVEVAEQEASQGGFVVAAADEQAQPMCGGWPPSSPPEGRSRVVFEVDEMGRSRGRRRFPSSSHSSLAFPLVSPAARALCPPMLFALLCISLFFPL